MAEHRLTAPEHAALVQELETVRARHETELARRLRHARGFGRSADSDDVLTVFEEAAIVRGCRGGGMTPVVVGTRRKPCEA